MLRIQEDTHGRFRHQGLPSLYPFAYPRRISRGCSFLKDYCVNTTIHGLRYIAEDDRHWSERLLWVGICMLAVCGATYMSLQVAERYRTSPTMTVVEGTSYPVYNIPFPAVTICDANRAHWDKVSAFEKQYLADVKNTTLESFRLLLSAMASIEFGDFDKIPQQVVDNPQHLQEIRHINITQLMLQVMPRCEDFFEGSCWWRNDDYNCCDLFELQRTEGGFCYSFNSEISEPMLQRTSAHNDTEDLRPRRTSSAGQWSGLRVHINTSSTIPPGSEITNGITLMVHYPSSFPLGGTYLLAGQSAQVDVTAHDTYTTASVRQLAPSRRQCFYADEGNTLGYGHYVQSNCMVECQRRYAVQYCNCTPYFYPNLDNVSVCDVMGMLCLYKFNSVFNYLKPAPGNPFFSDAVPGMWCKCNPDCDRQDFLAEIYVSASGDACRKHGHMVFMDVHFRQHLMVRYRTDVVFGWLDLIVAFGGIAGLFLGCSMLSGAEAAYYVTLRLWFYLRTSRPSFVAAAKVSPTIKRTRHLYPGRVEDWVLRRHKLVY